MKKILFIIVCYITSFCFSQVKENEVISKDFKGHPDLINFTGTKISSDKKSVNDFLKKQYNAKDVIEFREISDRSVVENLIISKKYQQFYKGIKVEFGIQNIVSQNDILTSSNGRYVEIEEIGIKPKLTEKEALSFATKRIGAKEYMWENKNNEIFIKKEQLNEKETFYPFAEIVIIEKDLFSEKPTPTLAYKFNIYASNPISRQFVYVDAFNGEILLIDPIIKHIQGVGDTRYSGVRNIETQQISGQYKLKDYSRGGGIETYNLNRGINYNNASDFVDNDNNWTSTEFDNPNKDNAALDAHWGAEKTYDYFLSKHNRNSYDGIGASIKNYVHFSSFYDNAFWDGQRMTYGDGGILFTPLTSIDVVGHEIGHGVCSSTANLIYFYESGAINEGLSDIWGAMVEYFADPSKQTYLIGEEIKKGGGALRSMSNPKVYSNPDTYKGINWYYGSGDNGGVHFNSGIMGHWFYILSEGKTGTNDLGNTYSITGIGKEKSAKIIYRAESVYFTQTTNYIQARNLTIQAAKDLYGVGSLEAIAVGNSWYAVGIGNAVWIGLPRIEIRLESTSNFATIYLIGANNTDIYSQDITSTTWTQIASTNGGSAGGNGFQGSGTGPNFYWTATLKIAATNSYGTTEITRDVTCAAPYPCNTNSYELTSINDDVLVANIIIDPCHGNTESKEIHQFDGKIEIKIYDFQGIEVCKSDNNSINIGNLKAGIYIVKMFIDNQVITTKIMKK